MGLRFKKSINLGSGVKVNINKNSISATGGIKGAHVTANSSGKVTKSAGISGTGISWRTLSGHSSKSGNSGCIVTSIKGFAIICIAVLMILYAWIPAIIAGIGYFIYCWRTRSPINKKYVILGSLIFVISLSAFIYNTINNQTNTPNTSVAVSSSQSVQLKT